jgi:hypothetical protein
MTEFASHPAASSLDADLKRARALANLLDAQFEVLGFRFGVDALVGLIPVAGDLAAFLAGLYPIMLARKHGFRKRVEARMWFNLGVDFIGGAVPLIGDVFDAAYRANLKNLKLLEDAARRRGRVVD